MIESTPRPDDESRPAGRREIIVGTTLGLGLPVVIAAGIALNGGNGRSFSWENLGAWMFLLAFPAALIGMILAIIPATRRGGLGMLLGCGLLLLLSWITCSMR